MMVWLVASRRETQTVEIILPRATVWASGETERCNVNLEVDGNMSLTELYSKQRTEKLYVGTGDAMRITSHRF